MGDLALLPSLPNLFVEGGDTGTSAMRVLQTLAQARTEYSDNTAGAKLDWSIVTFVLSGAFGF